MASNTASGLRELASANVLLRGMVLIPIWHSLRASAAKTLLSHEVSRNEGSQRRASSKYVAMHRSSSHTVHRPVDGLY